MLVTMIVKELIQEKLRVKMIAQGGKRLCVTLPDLCIRFIDSLNFIPKIPQAMWGCQQRKVIFRTFSIMLKIRIMRALYLLLSITPLST
ncbi:hypothetical protein PRIEUP_LOCUS4555 [Pristimantis euphronides]